MISRLKALKNYQGFLKYSKNTSWLIGERIFQMVIGLTVGVWVARYLGPEKYGILSYAISFVALFSAFATLGLNNIVTRNIVKDINKRDVLLGTSFIMKLIGAVLVLIALTLTVNFTSNDHQTNILIFIIAGGTIFQSFNVVDFYFQSQVLSKYVVYSSIFSLLISSILKVILILNNAPLIYFAWVILFESFFLASGYLFFYSNRKLSPLKWYFNKLISYSLIRDSWPLILSGLAVSIYMKVDQVMIKNMMDSESVGQYAVAVRLSTIWYFIPTVVSKSLFPAIINAKSKSEELYYSRLQRLYDSMVWIALTIAIPMTFFSNWLVNLLYGGQYDQSGDVLMIHIWAGVFVFLGVARTGWILTENLQKYSLIYLTIGMLCNLVLNYYFIKGIGIKGAAYATILSQCVAVLIVPYFIKETRISFFMMMKSLLFISLFKKSLEYINNK